MENSTTNNLNQEQINNLPDSNINDIPDGYSIHPNGLIYSPEGMASAKKESFIYINDREYPKSVPPISDPPVAASPSYEPSDYYTEAPLALPLTRWPELAAKVFDEDRWLIKNLIPKSGITLIAAPSGEKKTWVAMELMKCIAGGKSFLDTSSFSTVIGNVLYINGEMADQEVRRRGLQLGFGEVGESIFILTGEYCDLSNDATIDLLIETIEQYHIKAVFVDTFRAVISGIDENNGTEIREFFSKFMVLKNKEVSIIFLDHTRKPHVNEGKEPKKEQVVGSQDKVANLEVLLMLMGDGDGSTFTMYQRKNRLGQEIDPFKMSITDEFSDSGVKTTKFTYLGIQQEKIYKLDEAKDLIMKVLEVGNMTTNDIIGAGKEAQISPRNMQDALRYLRDKGHVILVGKIGHQNQYASSIQPSLMDLARNDIDETNFSIIT